MQCIQWCTSNYHLKKTKSLTKSTHWFHSPKLQLIVIKWLLYSNCCFKRTQTNDLILGMFSLFLRLSNKQLQNKRDLKDLIIKKKKNSQMLFKTINLLSKKHFIQPSQDSLINHLILFSKIFRWYRTYQQELDLLTIMTTHQLSQSSKERLRKFQLKVGWCIQQRILTILQESNLLQNYFKKLTTNLRKSPNFITQFKQWIIQTTL